MVPGHAEAGRRAVLHPPVPAIRIRRGVIGQVARPFGVGRIEVRNRPHPVRVGHRLGAIMSSRFRAAEV